MQAGDEVATFDLDVVRRFADLAVDGLASAREEIDALNVYPVPDGDTGTNMFLTVESARDALAEALEEHPGDLRAGMQAYSRGALLGARGNSGVILSQLVGALLRRIGQAGPDDRSASVFAEGMGLATEAAYSAVGEPVEGTILSVAKAASTGGHQGGRGSGRPARGRRARSRRRRPRGTRPDARTAAPAQGGRCRRRRWPWAVRGPRRGGVRDHRQAPDDDHPEGGHFGDPDGQAPDR